MPARKMGLGRGFESLIPTELLDEAFDPTSQQDGKVSDLRHIKLSEIIADPDQPRRTFDEVSLAELAASIREHGVLQPIVVTPHNGGYMVVAGERRFRASEKSGLDRIPAIIRTLSNQHKLEISLIENLQRRDLNPLETATAYLKLRDQFNLTLDEIGDRVGGKTPGTISNTLRLLRLPPVVREALASGQVREGQVRPLIGLEADLIEKILPRIIKEEWSARDAERYATRVKNGEVTTARTTVKTASTKYAERATKISKHFNTKVSVRPMAKGAGQIVLSYKNESDFERLVKLLDK